MRINHDFFSGLFDIHTWENCDDTVWRATRPTGISRTPDGPALLVPFTALKRSAHIANDPEVPPRTCPLLVRSYGGEIMRLTLDVAGSGLRDDSTNVMLEWDPSLTSDTLRCQETERDIIVTDQSGKERIRVDLSDPAIKHWSSLIEPPVPAFEMSVRPDGTGDVPFMAFDTFYPGFADSFPLGFVSREGKCESTFFALHAGATESFAGTGERFSRMDLAGQTISFFNEDGLGVNSRRAYKNIPFYISSKGYGLLVLTTSHMRMSFADLSTRTVQGVVNDDVLDLFIIGGGSPERIVNNYRRLTGFPRKPPVWSFGTWMGRMSYMSADEAVEVGMRMREEDFPCDVIHLDTGWFEKDWQCDWRFSPKTFPEPEKFLAEMRNAGYHVSLWQMPTISKENPRYPEASANGYLACRRSNAAASEFGGIDYAATIDFSNPEAVAWYRGMLRELLRLGASAIKTDFGESIDLEAEYHSLPASKLHNVYSLLYQKAAFEETECSTGEPLIWARSGWVGSHRYPVHWGGDAAATWDGFSGSLRGGLHLGVSGFAFWSADVPGTHGLPDFMNSWPTDELYIRWTQFGVLSSHLRYHGMQPREPYNYPGAAPTVRKWLKLRYCLLPYILEQADISTKSGMPVLRAMLFEHPTDRRCWQIDDQYYLGNALLVAPVMTFGGTRDVYLPEGDWVDFWSGEVFRGPMQIHLSSISIERVPMYVRKNAEISVYPEPVQHTGQMDWSNVVSLVFDDDYGGIGGTVVGAVTGLR